MPNQANQANATKLDAESGAGTKCRALSKAIDALLCRVMRATTAMKERPAKSFSAVPYREDGRPLNVARTEAEFERYIAWLADYLYRPKTRMPILGGSLARTGLVFHHWSRNRDRGWIWDHPFDDYPPDNYQPRHADILHRPELSKILSRVPDHKERRELLGRFYSELNTNALKESIRTDANRKMNATSPRAVEIRLRNNGVADEFTTSLHRVLVQEHLLPVVDHELVLITNRSSWHVYRPIAVPLARKRIRRGAPPIESSRSKHA